MKEETGSCHVSQMWSPHHRGGGVVGSGQKPMWVNSSMVLNHTSTVRKSFFFQYLPGLPLGQEQVSKMPVTPF